MSRRMLALLAAAVALVVGAWALIGNLGDNAGHPGHSSAAPRATSQGGASGVPVADKAKPLPLRPGERRLTLTMPVPYLPKAPTGVGTDDYRCFLLDPKLTKRAFLHPLARTSLRTRMKRCLAISDRVTAAPFISQSILKSPISIRAIARSAAGKMR